MKNHCFLFLTILLSSAWCHCAFGENAILDGARQEYYKDGKLKSEVVYQNGKKEGIEKVYSPDGKVLKEVTYENGEVIKIKGFVHPAESKESNAELMMLSSKKLNSQQKNFTDFFKNKLSKDAVQLSWDQMASLMVTSSIACFFFVVTFFYLLIPSASVLSKVNLIAYFSIAALTPSMLGTVYFITDSVSKNTIGQDMIPIMIAIVLICFMMFLYIGILKRYNFSRIILVIVSSIVSIFSFLCVICTTFFYIVGQLTAGSHQQKFIFGSFGILIFVASFISLVFNGKIWTVLRSTEAREAFKVT